MATKSPSSADSPVPNGVRTPDRRIDTPRPASLRGLNKPKCSKCGNVARSKCPFQSCKKCCASAQNPCHIHVLKTASILPIKLPNYKSTTEKFATDAPVSGSSIRVTSLQHLPTNLTRFIGAQNTLKTRRTLSRKDAAEINHWRFSKLKDYIERNKELEAEAFDRYMRNVGMLEEVFALNSTPGSSKLENEEDLSQIMIPGIKQKLKASIQHDESFKQKLEVLIDEGLQDIRKSEHYDGTSSIDEKMNLQKPKKLPASGSVDELIAKLDNAGTEDDLKNCIRMKAALFRQPADALPRTSEGDAGIGSIPNNGNAGDAKASELVKPSILFTPSFSMVALDQDALSVIEQQFLSRDIANL